MAEDCVNLQVLLSALAVLVGGAAAADEIVLLKSPERNQPAEFGYRFDTALTGSGFVEPKKPRNCSSGPAADVQRQRS
jgi:hypothetical protein